MYCKVSPTGKVHFVQDGRISYEYHRQGFIAPICGLTEGLKIDATEQEYKENGCKGCKKAMLSRAIARMKYGK